jgi:NAD(P)-dependent dehydrogenase (short-subunit alcohol dehydrogenase family)
MKRELEGKVVLITGGYQKLGSTIARLFSEHGASIIINDFDTPQMNRRGKKLLGQLKLNNVRAEAIPADLSSSHDIKQLCESALRKFGKVDILVNNAGPFNMEPYLELDEDTWDTIIDVNLKAIFLMSKELAPQMKKNGWGRIINMSAGSAFVRNHNVYSLAKTGVIVLTESLAVEFGPEITVNAVAPGQIKESLSEISKVDPDFGNRYVKGAPGGDLVTRSKVAEVIRLLCTKSFDAMTGETIRLDYGAEIPVF